MISVIENESGYVIAYAQWDVVDKCGKWDKWGDFIWIREMWIHGDFRDTRVLSELCETMYRHPLSQVARYVYWEIVRARGQKICDDIPRENLVRRTSRAYYKDDLYKAFTKRSRSYAIH